LPFELLVFCSITLDYRKNNPAFYVDSARNHAEPDGNARGETLFATTLWTVVAQARDGDSIQAREALERLCGSYWYPLYAHVRRQGHSREDAQDLTQEFFARLLAGNYISLADRNRGRFRTFLLTALKHFLINEWRKGNSLKRGHGQTIISLDQEAAESRFAAEPSMEQPPDALYDRRWAAVLLDRALAALSGEFEESSKRDSFERLKVFVWGEKNTLSYTAMAEQLGMSEGTVRVSVHRLRKRYGELLRAEIAQTVATPAEITEELRYLISVIRNGLANSGNVARENL
jgi:RNA polymerase sigma factor (sigma-70 family)